MKKIFYTLVFILSGMQFSYSQAIDWATFYGGATGSAEQSNAIEVSNAGALYVGAQTNATDFPDALNSSGGGQDGLLIKFDTLGNQKWALHLGGAATEEVRDIAVLNDSTIIVVGNTVSIDYPTTPDGFQLGIGGFDDAFITIIDSAGTILYSTYFGGTLADGAEGICVDGSDIYITGHTASTDFPTITPTQPANAGGTDGWLVNLSSALVFEWCTYLGGSFGDYPRKVTTDDAGNIYIGGRTQSVNLDSTAGAFQPTSAGGTYDAYIQKLTPDGVLDWSTFYGGGDDDRCHDIGCDGESIFITGETFSSDFPSTAGAFQPTIGSAGQVDAFLAKLDTSGVQKWSTFYGTSNVDRSYRLTVASDGSIGFCGYSASFSMPVTGDAAQASMAGIYDAFVSRFDSTGAHLYCSYLGGSNLDNLFGITDFAGDIYVSGSTRSTDWPATSGAYQLTHAGGTEDITIGRFGFPGPVCFLNLDMSGNDVTCFGDGDGTGTATAVSGTGPYSWNWDVGTGSQTTETAVGLGPGWYYVTITDADGCTYNDSIEVIEPPLLEAIIISTEPDEGGCEGIAGVSAVGGVGPHSFLWDAGGGFAGTAVATGLCEGTACVTITDANGCTADTCVAILSVAGIEENTSRLLIYPNPTRNLITVECSEISSYELLSIGMKKIKSGTVNQKSTLNLTELPQGNYFLKIRNDSGVVVKKIVKI